MENWKHGFGLGRNSAVSWANMQSVPILHSFARQNLHMRVNCTAFFCSALVMLDEAAVEGTRGFELCRLQDSRNECRIVAKKRPNNVHHRMSSHVVGQVRQHVVLFRRCCMCFDEPESSVPAIRRDNLIGSRALRCASSLYSFMRDRMLWLLRMYPKGACVSTVPGKC